MEKGNVPRGRSRAQRQEAISRIIPVLKHLTDTQLCAWLKEGTHPSDREIEIASCVAGDRLCGSLTAVSYTHLDVYKRQGWSSSVARWAHNPEVHGSNPCPATSKG